MPQRNLTRDFSAVLCGWTPSEPDVTPVSRLLILDGLAIAAAGAGEPGPRIMARLVRDEDSHPVAAVIGQGFSTSAAAAARVNGMAMHVLDFEPMWSPPNHALSPILPALLALAEHLEHKGAPPLGDRVVRALAKGIEAQGRLRLASNQLEPKDLSLHPPGIVGPLAAAAACCDLLGLDSVAMANAIGIAASRAGGILANVGSMTKAMHCGDAAALGLDAAVLSAHGFTSDSDALAGPRGFGNSYFGAAFEPSWLTEPLRVPRVLDPGPAWKLFPSQYATHFVITAALDARADIRDPSAIEAVELRVPVMPYIDRPLPKSGLDGKFSWQYTAAAALIDGAVRPTTFSDARRFAPDMERLLPRIRLVADSEIPGRFDRMYVELEVLLRSGQKISTRCDGPVGSWSSRVESAKLREKAVDLMSSNIGSEAANAVLSMLSVPGRLPAIRELMAALRGHLATADAT